MNKTTEALKLAEEVLTKANHFHDYEDELAAIREALAEPVKQEPICNLWVDPVTRNYVVDHCDHPIEELIPAYATPADSKTIRAEALEEAAKVCEKAMIQMNYSEAPYKQCAAAIRGLK